MSQLTKTRASEILQTLRERKVLVLGDVMLDEFVWGDVTRISPEGPVPVVDVRRESVHLGGAANVLRFRNLWSRRISGVYSSRRFALRRGQSSDIAISGWPWGPGKRR